MSIAFILGAPLITMPSALLVHAFVRASRTVASGMPDTHRFTALLDSSVVTAGWLELPVLVLDDGVE